MKKAKLWRGEKTGNVEILKKRRKLSVTRRNKATEISMLKDKIIKSFRESVKVFEYEEAIGVYVMGVDE